MPLAVLLGLLVVPFGGCSGSRYLKSSDVDVIPVDGEFYQPEQVTAGNESNFAPELSPNGAFVVYTSDRKGNKDIWEKRASGGYAQPLTSHAADDFSPVISHNGKKIAFVSRRNDAAGDIHILSPGFSLGAWWDGSKEGAIEVINQKQSEDSSPSWYPDNNKIVFAARQPGAKVADLMVADLNDLKAQPLGDAKGDQPTVSPDGLSVAFVRDGALFLFDQTTEKITQLTEGGLVQDGQPRFTLDGQQLLFIRYADDTNNDDKLNGDDHPTVWILNLDKQLKEKNSENFHLMPLTSAAFAAFSPQKRGPFLYFTLQQDDSLDIFKLPEFGQLLPAKDLLALKKQIDSLADDYSKIFALRKAAATFALLGSNQEAAEAALLELEWQSREERRVESEILAKKIKKNFPEQTEIISLVDLQLLQLDLSPLLYPQFNMDLSVEDQKKLGNLLNLTEKLIIDAKTRRIEGQAKLLKAKILASQRAFFAANELLISLLKELENHNDLQNLAAECAYYSALIAPATSDVATAIRGMRQVVTNYGGYKKVVNLASTAAVAMLSGSENEVEDLVSLRTEAKGLPILPAVAHMRIVKHFEDEKKVAVAANELRLVVDNYPESPEIIIEAAEKLTRLEEKSGRQVQAEKMLLGLIKTLNGSAIGFQDKAKNLLIGFYLRQAETLIRDNEPVLALKQYRKVLAIHKMEIDAHRGIIDASYKIGVNEWQKIVAESEEMSSKNPEDSILKYLYGYALTFKIDQQKTFSARLNAIEDAIEVLEEARQLDSKILQVHQTLGWLYLQKGHWQDKYYAKGGVRGSISKRTSLVQGFFGYGDPNWLELGIDSFLTAYFLSQEESLARASLAQNLGNTYYELKNFQKSLNYYMQRIRMLPLFPMREGRREGILLRRAGRSAFNIDELGLAESLQKEALKAWEELNSDVDVAYSLDALALTLREQGKFTDAALRYQRLLEINQRTKNQENIVATLSNLGYCAFMNNQFSDALKYFDQAELELENATNASAVVEAAADAKKVHESDPDAIKVDLGAQGSAAKGFDSFGRQNLILSFRAQIYEKAGRLDLATKTFEKRLDLLENRRQKLIDEGGEKATLAEELSIVKNRIGELKLAQGDQLQAKKSFAAAVSTAKLTRAKEQTYMTRGEWVNAINQGRVQLRLASLGLISNDEIGETVAELEAAAAGLRAVHNEGSKAEARPLTQILALSASLSAMRIDPQGAVNRRQNLEEALLIGKKTQLPFRFREGPLLAYLENTKNKKVGPSTIDPKNDSVLKRLLKDFEKQATVDPELEWRYWASQKNASKAFEALDRFILGGGVLPAPQDRLASRVIFERILKKESYSDHPEQISLLLRRYQIMRQTDLARRSLGSYDDTTKSYKLSKALEDLLTLKDQEDLADVLTADGQKNVILSLYKTIDGEISAVLQTPSEVKAAKIQISNALGLASQSYENLLKPMDGLWPKKGEGYIYLVPSGDLIEVPWENILVEGERLSQKNPLVYLASVDHLPALYSKRTIPKNRLGHVPWPTKDDYLKDLAADDRMDYQQLSGNDEVFSSHSELLEDFNLIHIDAPLRLNEIEPKETIITLSPSAKSGGVNFSRSFMHDLTIKQLAGLDLPSAQLFSFSLIQRDTKQLVSTEVNNEQGHDGWVLLSMAFASAQVPSILMGISNVDTMNLPQDPEESKKNWKEFYSNLKENSAAEARQKVSLKARIVGYGGMPGAAEVSYAKANLEETLDDSEDAFDGGDYAEAANSFRKAHYFTQRIGDRKKEYDTLDRLVQTLFLQRNYKRALLFKKKMARIVKENIKTDEAEAMDYAEVVMDAAVLAVRGQEGEEAERLLTEAEVIFTEEDEKARLGKVYLYRGINLENQKKYQETIVAYEKSRALFLDVDPPQAAARLLDIGNIYRNNLSDYSQALEYYGQAADEFKKLGKQEAYLPVMIDKANTLMTIGQLESTIGILQKEVIPQINSENNRNLWIRAEQILANAYFRAGLYQEASQHNELALQASAKIENKLTQVDRELDAVNLGAMIKAKLRQYDEAFLSFKSAIAKAEEFKLKNQVAVLYNNFGFWMREYGNVDQSLEYFDIALRIDQELSSRSSIAYDQRNMGLSVILKGDYNRARNLLKTSLKTSEELNLAYNIVYCYFGLGDMALREGNPDEAEDYFRKALSLSEKGYMQDFVWRAHSAVATTIISRRNEKLLPAAASEFAKSIAMVEKLKAGLKTEDSRNAFQSDLGVQEVYRDYSVVLMKLGKPDEAWKLSERARARAFIDTLGNQKLKLAKKESLDLLVEETNIKTEIEVFDRRINQLQNSPKTPTKKIIDLKNQQKEALSRHAATIAKMKSVDHQLANFVAVETTSVEELQKYLPSDTALIEYMVTPDALLIWVIKNGKITGKSVNIEAKNLQKSVKDYRELMQNYSTIDYLGSELSKILINPVAHQLTDVKRLAIVPHDALHFLSFASLPIKAGQFQAGQFQAGQKNSAENEYLLDRFSIFYLESATMSKFFRGDYSAPKKSQVIAFASAEDKLPFVGREIEAMGRYFPDIKARFGAAASKEAVVAEAGAYNIVHIASHGEYDPVSPGSSKLLLANQSNLTVNDVFGLSLPADLVTLSACETGLGKISAGDEIIGLGRAFHYAGSPSVVSNLWRVSDVASAVVMKRFYRYLSEGETKVDALKHAQMITKKYFKHPAYWASFRLSGDYR